MPTDEDIQFYEARARYQEKCQDFKEQQTHFLENFKPHHYGKEQSTPAHL